MSRMITSEDCSSSTPSRKLKVTLLTSEWGSSKGGLSTINRELATQLAKHDNLEVCMYLPWCSDEDKNAAADCRVILLKAKERAGYNDPIDWLAFIPRDHQMDVVIGHGIHLGRQVPLIKDMHPECKWIQVVHTVPEEYGMFKTYPDSTATGEKKHEAEVKLCREADQVVAIGPKLTEAFARYLRPCGDVLNLTPGIFSEFAGINQATGESKEFHILLFGRGDSEDFQLKGYDIAAKAVAMLNESFKLVFVGAPHGKEDEVKETFLKEGISRRQLTVRRAREREQLAQQFYEADLVIMPSRTEGFGLAALEALSAGLPVLVSGNSGLAEALEEVPFGTTVVVKSEDPAEWEKAIQGVRRKRRYVRLKEASVLRKMYSETYKWEEQCSKLIEKLGVIKG
ncbi:D-inositol 3-phosphate glycosyltransferase-like [Acropora millepora]|uniref:D-inositol 3-phosphate glycosyltransferase-like n=1 Tax=Acropora millepora TaxID=45264 RepID=UPI001CF526C6|nr:D-inositol 3-phosphate glycosyltransferase-like [Acropora millepora]